MKALIIFITILTIVSGSVQLNAQNKLDVDSVDIIVKGGLMDYNIYMNSYIISDMELDWIEKEHPDWIITYFPTILERYDCTLYSQFSLAASLYQKGNPKYLCSLWGKYGRLFEYNGKRVETWEIKELWMIFDAKKINPQNLKGCQ